MKGRILIFFLVGLAFSVLTLLGGRVRAAEHISTCPLSHVGFIPSVDEDSNPEEIVIGHSHLYSTPERTKSESHRYKLRGLQRNFSIEYLVPASIRSAPVDSASLSAPPRYNAPDCLYPQHIYLFRLTLF